MEEGFCCRRIVHVAIHEHASEETLQAYAKLEIAAMDRGMFLLEVIVAGAPLIGLLGTVTGLVEVFSQMPTGGAVDKSLFTQGISLALLTTMTGLTIALPTIFFNAYLHRVIDKRAVALGWLTARLIEASDRKGTPPRNYSMNLRSSRRKSPRVDVIPLIDVLMVLILFSLPVCNFRKFGH